MSKTENGKVLDALINNASKELSLIASEKLLGKLNEVISETLLEKGLPLTDINLVRTVKAKTLPAALLIYQHNEEMSTISYVSDGERFVASGRVNMKDGSPAAKQTINVVNILGMLRDEGPESATKAYQYSKCKKLREPDADSSEPSVNEQTAAEILKEIETEGGC